MIKYLLPTYQIIAHLSILIVIFYFDITLFLLSILTYLIMITVGISAGYHRLLSHRSYKAPQWFKNLSLLIGSLGIQTSALTWVAMHRQHHGNSDTEKDPHSPTLKGLLYTYFGIIMFQPKISFAKDLLKDKSVIFFHKYYFQINILYDVLLFIINPIYVVYFHLFPAAILWHAEAAINVWTHTNYFGYRNYDTNDKSKNIHLLGWLVAGEGYHNNHHNSPTNYNFAHKNNEWDLAANLIKFVKV